jgi:hypothetical protein
MVVKFRNTIWPIQPQLSLHRRAALSSNSNGTQSAHKGKQCCQRQKKFLEIRFPKIPLQMLFSIGELLSPATFLSHGTIVPNFCTGKIRKYIVEGLSPYEMPQG